MDLSLIRSKLESGAYSDPWNFIDDIMLMFDNAWLYNRKTSKVYKFCSKVWLIAAHGSFFSVQLAATCTALVVICLHILNDFSVELSVVLAAAEPTY